MLKQVANAITSCRILCSLLLLIFDLFSIGFYITYILCGFSDMIDGSIARKTNSVSEFGSKFDTVADLVFVAVSMIKLLPTIYAPKWLLVWIVVIGVIRTINIIWGYVYNKKFISMHTKMNKIAGLLLFLLPLTLSYVELGYSLIAVCSIATVASIQEGLYIGNSRNKKSIGERS